MSVNMFLFCKLIHLYQFSDSTYKWYDMVSYHLSVFLFLTYFTQMTISRSVHIAANGIISFFLQLSNVVQSLSRVWFFLTPWTAAQQASLSFTISRSLLKLMFIESVMPSNHFILCHPLLLLPSIFLSFRVFPNESILRVRWPKYCSFSFSISPSNEYSGLTSFRID